MERISRLASILERQLQQLPDTQQAELYGKDWAHGGAELVAEVQGRVGAHQTQMFATRFYEHQQEVDTVKSTKGQNTTMPSFIPELSRWRQAVWLFLLIC